MSTLNLMPGDMVEIRSYQEILATLDDAGAIDELPFMPEMRALCGQQIRVFKRADKTCDTIDGTGGRRMYNTVHLADTRCDGSGHGGCEARCLMFWKEAWLKRVEPGQVPSGPAEEVGEGDLVDRGTRQPGSPETGRDILYRCQITELKKASEPLPWWDLRQYVRDLRTGNTTVRRIFKAMGMVFIRKLASIGIGYRYLVAGFNRIQKWRGRPPFPFSTGKLAKETPTGLLDLKVGEWVRVKSLDEIMATLDGYNRNRGLYFDPELVRYCGGTYPVLGRVSKILDEKTGRMLNFSNPCIVLQDVYCRSGLSRYRLFCPRAIYSYWREIWLERVSPPDEA